MWRSFRHPTWRSITAAAVLVVVVAIAAVLVLARRGSTGRQLSYDVLYDEPLLPVRAPARHLEVLVDGRPVQEATLTVVRVRNSGTEPIRSEDYEGPIQLRFGDGATVLSAEVSDTAPARLPASVAVTSDGVDLQPLLLNAGDWVQVSVVLDRDTPDVQVDARIAGIKEVIHRHAAADSGVARALQRLRWAVAILVAVTLPLVAAVVRSVAVEVSRRVIGRRGGVLKGEHKSGAEDVPSGD